ncbi:SDR family NAD(P)-dependent oxidoreductase [Sphingobium nicotianae]|uniref:SDR family NAD(P)-dependent oxidoreductase n=1 Tax=Sphingobium nicotianae TaxID=2782607 RepID=A0A9X1DEQ4_9SPHN|nr:SDR family NAD(P)-dependent oxidoreductase [Sphingobium nicotianae]MBT2188837.1 SDR family NAD(P)-dependent oxidoreductase [Sphingobium nicotianae]
MGIEAIAPGKLAVVTGGASGIGLAAARHFVGVGMRVCLLDWSDNVAELATELGGEATGFRIDVSDRAAVEALAADIVSRFGPVSVLMNNAGVGRGGDALSNPDGWARVLGVNLFGVLHCVQAFVPAMVAGDAPGLVINTGSKQGITQPPGDTAYNVSKSGVKSLTEGLAHTLMQQTGGRVSAHLLIPGFTYTGLTARGEKPAAAWTAEQVIDFMMESLARGDFYILCPDNDVTRVVDERRIAWAAGDIIENRPALSRWHPDWEARFAAYMAET